MARLYIKTKTGKNLIKIKSKGVLKEDLSLKEIDYLTLMCGKNFIKEALKANCIKDEYIESIYIEHNNIKLEPVMFDDSLKEIVETLYKNDTDIIDNNPLFQSDIDLLLSMLDNNFVFNKIVNYLNDNTLTYYLSNYRNNKTGYSDIILYFTQYENYRKLRSYYRKNIHYLCLVLDNESKRYLILEKGDKVQIDEYTMTLQDSSVIRRKYQDKIAEYLKNNQEYLNSIRKNSSGYIVILSHGRYSMMRKKVLYKDTKSKINEFVSDLNLVKMVAYNDYRNNDDSIKVFSDYQNKVIHYQQNGVRSGYQNMIQSFKKDLFINKRYDEIRKILYIIKDSIKNTMSPKRERIVRVLENPSKVENKEDETEIQSSYYDKEEFLTEEEYSVMSGGDDNNTLWDKSNFCIMKKN